MQPVSSLKTTTIKLPPDLLDAARRKVGDDFNLSELVRYRLAELAGIDPPPVRMGRRPRKSGQEAPWQQLPLPVESDDEATAS